MRHVADNGLSSLVHRDALHANGLLTSASVSLERQSQGPALDLNHISPDGGAPGYAAALARARRLDIRFSVTTNATLLMAADLELIRSHPFAVTVSLDGAEANHDRRRPRHMDGFGSWKTAIDKISPLLEQPGTKKIAARATVTRGDFDRENLSAVGFQEVGPAPLRVGPTGCGALMDAPIGRAI